MGNLLSGVSTDTASTSIITRNIDSESETMEDINLRDSSEVVTEEQFYDSVSDDEEKRAKLKEEEMNEFRKELSVKREQRREILTRHRNEKKELENALHNEIKSKIDLCETNRLLRELLVRNNIDIPEDLQGVQHQAYITDSISHMAEEIEKLKTTNVTLRCDLAKTHNALQSAYSDIADLSFQNSASMKQINALKEVVSVSKTMISLREQQLNELKDKLTDIEQSLADRETSMLSTDLRQEYERQLLNIRTLRGLYEERARLADVSRQALSKELDEHKVLLEAESNKTKELTAKVNDLETKVNDLEETVEDKNNLISTCQQETRGIKAEMSVVNKLFSQVLLGYKNKQDLDVLIHRLEENHGLLTQMAGKENGSEVSSELPKLLLELVSQIDEHSTAYQETTVTNSAVETGSGLQNTTAEEIVENLPKVWRVLIELLSHQSETDAKSTEKVTTCYKSVETKSGPVLVPSVSQTYIRLKELILEKLTLIKEVNRTKQLNTHLESRLEEQERRLCLVTNELSKTWNVVGRLRRHHHQLHTHEKILKYELQQKRKLLNELKEELEYCRDKWEQAREKNTQSEKDWKKLRTEFSNRKLKPDLASINNSAESGYSDEKQSEESSESNDESEYVEPKIKCKKKLKKSFETNIDSSADFNLAAEREDPASDLLDVADLPLDTQEENQECDDVSDSFNSESLFKNEKFCEETEDEAADMTNEEHSIAGRSPDCSVASTNENLNNITTQNNPEIPGTSTSNIVHVTIDPAAILKSIREQNERLAQKDKRLERLENSGSNLLRKTQTIAKLSDQINSTLDGILNRPSSSRQSEDVNLRITENFILPDNIVNELPENVSSDNSDENQILKNDLETSNTSEPLSKYTNSESNLNDDQTTNKVDFTSLAETTTTDSENVDFKVILEDIKRQDENLKLKDKRLENLEQGCSELVKNISQTLETGSAITAKLEVLHNKCQNEVPNNETSDEQLQDDNNHEDYGLVSESNSSKTNPEPSSSKELDHEARFAARDLRLKRLEEQTKSLVNKVNKTATKGVKIHYKLEELHNIYGSENSRSGTPSEDTEDTSQNDDLPNE
ncbi:myosin-2 heavy chain [Bicyclus anynana]|uniref:Myosin-2 heavy chain n=1 Tax=Bicyclus anynana TaxID=110368 RepID=A0A6J1P442_BICAN|nr:myosin-2 heavy chain [Bicyclus anynana]